METRYRIPNICCCCGKANPSEWTTIKSKGSYSSGVFETTYFHKEVSLPVCAICKKAEKKYRRKWSLIGLLGVPFFLFELLYLLFMFLRYTEMIWLSFAIGLLLIYFAIITMQYILGDYKNSFAGTWDSSCLSLKSKEFVKLFCLLNNFEEKDDVDDKGTMYSFSFESKSYEKNFERDEN